MTEDIKKVTRTGLILAVTLILQGLRLVIPIPPQVSRGTGHQRTPV